MPLLLKPVEPSRGLRWIGDAFRLFGRKPLAFTALFAVFLVLASVVALVPLLGTVVQLMALPLVSLGFMVAGQSALLDGPVHPRQYLEPLTGDPQRRRSLLTLSVLYGVLALCLLMVADAASDSAFRRLQEAMAQQGTVATPGGGGATAPSSTSTPPASAPSAAAPMTAPEGVGTAVLLVLGLGTLLSVPFWHAPALVHWGGQGVQQALFSSTVAVWRSKGAFAVYLAAWVGLTLLFGILGAMLFALLGLAQMAGVLVVPGLMVMSAVFYLSVLFTFNDSFGGSPARAAEEPPPSGP